MLVGPIINHLDYIEFHIFSLKDGAFSEKIQDFCYLPNLSQIYYECSGLFYGVLNVGKKHFLPLDFFFFSYPTLSAFQRKRILRSLVKLNEIHYVKLLQDHKYFKNKEGKMEQKISLHRRKRCREDHCKL